MINYNLYFDYKLFELIRDRLLPIINKYRSSGRNDDTYKHIFIAPEALATRRAFKLKGVLNPYVCVWSPSHLVWNPKLYGRSVLSRDFSYMLDNQPMYCSGYLYDSQKTYNIVASSYYADFAQKVQQEIQDFDRLRYFSIDCSELLPGFTTKIEFLLKQINLVTNLDEEVKNRECKMTASYDVKITYPVVSIQDSINRVELYLNKNKIYEFG